MQQMFPSEEQIHVEARRQIMRVLSHAEPDEIDAAVSALVLPGFSDLRSPEVGLVMLRGRIGGDGAVFNVGEATVTRAAVRLDSGEVGHSYVLGRAPQKARQAALVDALWQVPGMRAHIETEVIEKLDRLQAERAAKLAARTAATKVDFFTLVRGEDQ